VSRGQAVAAAVGCALALSACGGQNARKVLSETAGNLGEIRSGTLHLRLRLDPHGPGTPQPFGFTLDGPFALPRATSLPVARIAYTQSANGRTTTVTVYSTGEAAYVRSNGRVIRLGPAQEAQLRQAAGGLRSGGLSATLPLDDWIEHPKLSDGGTVGGAETDRVSADLRVENVVRDLLALARGAGQQVPQLQGQDLQRIADSVRSGGIDVWTGKQDRLLRKLDLEADLGLDVPRALRAALGALVGAKLTLELGIDRPNQPIPAVPPPG
jgi:hypothetical protein